MVRRWPDRFKVYALVAGENTEILARQILEFRPKVAVVATTSALESLTERLEDSGLSRKDWPDLQYGPEARVQAATADDVDFVLSAIVGVAGLEATYEAVRRQKTIGLANKEVLVASGKLVMDAARQHADDADPGRQRTQWSPPVPAGRSPGRGSETDSYGVGRPFRKHRQIRARFCDSSASFESSNMEDGATHYH